MIESILYSVPYYNAFHTLYVTATLRNYVTLDGRMEMVYTLGSRKRPCSFIIAISEK